jgi:hypothetical protein
MEHRIKIHKNVNFQPSIAMLHRLIFKLGIAEEWPKRSFSVQRPSFLHNLAKVPERLIFYLFPTVIRDLIQKGMKKNLYLWFEISFHWWRGSEVWVLHTHCL